jgi:hypothetical protein
MAAPLKPDPHSGERDLEKDRRILADTAPEFIYSRQTLLETPVFEAPE